MEPHINGFPGQPGFWSSNLLVIGSGLGSSVLGGPVLPCTSNLYLFIYVGYLKIGDLQAHNRSTIIYKQLWKNKPNVAYNKQHCRQGDRRAIGLGIMDCASSLNLLRPGTHLCLISRFLWLFNKNSRSTSSYRL